MEARAALKTSALQRVRDSLQAHQPAQPAACHCRRSLERLSNPAAKTLQFVPKQRGGACSKAAATCDSAMTTAHWRMQRSTTTSSWKKSSLHSWNALRTFYRVHDLAARQSEGSQLSARATCLNCVWLASMPNPLLVSLRECGATFWLWTHIICNASVYRSLSH